MPDNGIIELNPLTSFVDNAANILHSTVLMDSWDRLATSPEHHSICWMALSPSVDSVFSWFTRSFILGVLNLKARLTQFVNLNLINALLEICHSIEKNKIRYSNSLRLCSMQSDR
ncbi:hypothetical protein L596_026580 [Steinernema carpocapsae]|uniref:Uncharacterized protein n=1 Tax=Steinernema carpocapsae TaxID=34508 RepID=A0A4U5M2S3_STECR|nr:hypothetical protein L596_026580 [Steinernema carpocapsae]